MQVSRLKTVQICLLAMLLVLGSLLTGCDKATEVKQDSAPAPAETVTRTRSTSQEPALPPAPKTAANPQEESQSSAASSPTAAVGRAQEAGRRPDAQAAPDAPRITNVEIRHCSS